MEQVREENELRENALCAQYSVLQNRIALHGSRLWQLPFTYVSFTAIATPVAFSVSNPFPLPSFFAGLAVVGVLVMGCMLSAWLGYRRTGRNMNEVERKLGIGVYTRFGLWHAAPYFLLTGSVVAGVSLLAVFSVSGAQ